jgi:replication factor C subunit 3/5
MTTIPWTEKYRPIHLDGIIAQNDVVNVLKTFIQKKCLPHLLFYGPPGTGKTSTIVAAAKELYGQYTPFMVMELNASDDRGIEVVRNRIIQFANTASVFYGTDETEKKDIFKLVILDETDAMTSDAQAILRKVVENYTSNTRFCLICNYIQNINLALQSRCTRFRFSPLDKISIKKKILQITKIENVKITNKGIDTIINKCNGDLRKVLNVLQSTSMAYDVVNENNVNNCMGLPQNNQIKIIINSLINDTFKKSYNKIQNLKLQFGISLTDILYIIHDVLLEFLLTNKTNSYDISNLTENQIKYIFTKIREIEFNQSTNTTETIQLTALIGIFNNIKN